MKTKPRLLKTRIAVFSQFLRVQGEGTADSGVNGCPVRLCAYKMLSRQSPGLSQTTDWLYRRSYECGPPVKSQSSRPEEFRVQETRAWGVSEYLEVKVEWSDSGGGTWGCFTQWCSNWASSVMLYICMAGVQDVYEKLHYHLGPRQLRPRHKF